MIAAARSCLTNASWGRERERKMGNDERNWRISKNLNCILQDPLDRSIATPDIYTRIALGCLLSTSAHIAAGLITQIHVTEDLGPQ